MVSAVHHHRPTIKSANKSFKSRHATKSSIRTKNKGKVSTDTASISSSTARKSPYQQLQSKLDRRNKARQQQANKHKDLLKETRLFDGRHGAPRIVAVVPLCEDGDAAAAVRLLSGSIDIDAEVAEVVPEGSTLTPVDRFKQKIQWLTVRRDLLRILDACRIADFIILLLSSTQEVDSTGELIIRSIEAQGISNTVVTVQHLRTVENPKRKAEVKKSLLSYIGHFFPAVGRVYDLETPQEAGNVLRGLCTQTPRGVGWRDARSYLLVDEAQWEDGDGEGEGMLKVAGVVRGRGLNPDRLVHIQNYGDFQIDKICAYPTDAPKAHSGDGNDAMAVDAPVSPVVLAAPTADQDSLLDLAPEADMRDVPDGADIPDAPPAPPRGVLLDDHHYFDDDIDTINVPYERPVRVPAGTSTYQSAWILSDDSDGDSDGDGDSDHDLDLTDQPQPQPEDGLEGLLPPGTEAPTTFSRAPSEVDPDLSLDPAQEADSLAAFRARADEDLSFPDELELPPTVLARERLSRYRGLKSLRSSPWETSHDAAFQPACWERLAQVPHYRGARKAALSEALVGGVAAGTKVWVYLRCAPRELLDQQPGGGGGILAVYSLLRHEHKKAVVNYTLTPPSTLNTATPIKAKDTLLLQLGPRRILINPLFSSAGTAGPNNVSKFERFLAPGRTTIATAIAPLTFGNVPAVYFRADPVSGALTLLGTGSVLNADHSRVVAKRVVLTGHPFKIHKKLVTVRYMFFNKEDVDWFKAIPLFTRRGRSGFVKESLGTHGYFKATFDGRISPQDAVALSLYKRVFPRESVEYRG